MPTVAMAQVLLQPVLDGLLKAAVSSALKMNQESIKNENTSIGFKLPTFRKQTFKIPTETLTEWLLIMGVPRASASSPGWFLQADGFTLALAHAQRVDVDNTCR